MLVSAVRAILRHHNVPKDWWDFAMTHANEVLNMMPSKALDDRSPIYMWTSKIPDVSRLRVFGCLAYAHLDGRKLPKLSARAVPCVYLGHELNGDGWKLWNWTSDKVIVCRSVEFFEGQSAFSVPAACSWMKQVDPELLWEPLTDDEDESEKDDSSVESNDDLVVPEEVEAVLVDKRHSGKEGEDTQCMPFHIDVSFDTSLINNKANAKPLKKPAEKNTKASQESGYVTQEIDISDFTDCEYGLVATLTSKLPAEIEKFKQAMIDEIQALNDLKVYEEADVKRGTHIIGVKWVLKEKKATSLSPAKLKARLVAKGFTQQYGVNYEETHAPVARTASIRTVFAVCAAKGWKVHQIDVNNAYLNGEMDMDGVYIRQPPYFVDPNNPN